MKTMADFKKLLWAFPIGIVVSLYTTFIIQKLWNWFAVPALHVPEISFWGIYGLVLLVSILAEDQKGANKSKDEQRWRCLYHALDACIPAEKRDVVMEQIDEAGVGMWARIVSEVFGKVIGNTLTLIIGWVVHAFLA